MVDYSSIAKACTSRFGAPDILVRSPARISIIGEHVDYNEGYTLAAAIDRVMVIAIRSNHTNQFRVLAVDLKEEFTSEEKDFQPGKHWSNYVMGVLSEYKKRTHHSCTGLDIVLGGDIPVGAGLSSSAALCCGIAFAINELWKGNLTHQQIAHIAQQAEHQFVGVKCGLLDQYSNLLGKKDAALLLDFRTLDYTLVKVPLDDYEWILINTKVKHLLTDTPYNDRRNACAQGVLFFQQIDPTIRSLRDVTLENLMQHQHELDADTFIKCKYVVMELSRVSLANQWLQQKKMVEFGQLLWATHWGLSNDYEVSCPELDFLVRRAQQSNQVIGARMMGGGFGGCTINIIKKDCVQEFCAKACHEFNVAFGHSPEIYPIHLVDGTSTIDAL